MLINSSLSDPRVHAVPAERALRPPRPHVQLGAADLGQRHDAPLRLQGKNMIIQLF